MMGVKVIIFKGISPISFSGEFGEVVLQNGGVLNSIDENLWAEVEKQYSEIIGEFVKGGFIIFSNSKSAKKQKNGEKVIVDQDVSDDEDQEGADKQNRKENDAKISFDRLKEMMGI